MRSSTRSHRNEEQRSELSVTDTDFLATTEQDFEGWFPMLDDEIQEEVTSTGTDASRTLSVKTADSEKKKAAPKFPFFNVVVGSLTLFCLLVFLHLMRQKVAIFPLIKERETPPKQQVSPPDKAAVPAEEKYVEEDWSKPYPFHLQKDFRMLKEFIGSAAHVKTPEDAVTAYGQKFLGGDKDALRGFVAFAKEKLREDILTQEPDDHLKRIQRDWNLCKLHLVALTNLEAHVFKEMALLKEDDIQEKERLNRNLIEVYRRKRIAADKWGFYHSIRGISSFNQKIKIREFLRSFSIYYARQENILEGKEPTATPAAQGIRGIPKKVFADLCGQLDPTDRWLTNLIL